MAVLRDSSSGKLNRSTNGKLIRDAGNSNCCCAPDALCACGSGNHPATVDLVIEDTTVCSCADTSGTALATIMNGIYTLNYSTGDATHCTFTGTGSVTVTTYSDAPACNTVSATYSILNITAVLGTSGVIIIGALVMSADDGLGGGVTIAAPVRTGTSCVFQPFNNCGASDAITGGQWYLVAP